jgi:hypothetical protein
VHPPARIAIESVLWVHRGTLFSMTSAITYY